MSELTITDLTFNPSATQVSGRDLYVAFQQGTQVHSTGTSVNGTWTEHVQFRNAQLHDTDAQMLITVCAHHPPNSPEVVGQTVVSVSQLLSSTVQQTFSVFNYSGQCTGTVAFRSAHKGQNFSSAPAAQTAPTTDRTNYPASATANNAAGTSAAYPTAYGSATTTGQTTPAAVNSGTGAAAAGAGVAAGAGAGANQAVRKPGLLDQARVGLVDTLSSLHRGLEHTKTQMAGHHRHTGATQGTAAAQGTTAAQGTAAAPGAGVTRPVGGTGASAPPPGQSYQTQELPRSLLNDAKALLTDMASYTQYGIEKAKVAIAPKPAAAAP